MAIEAFFSSSRMSERTMYSADNETQWLFTWLEPSLNQMDIISDGHVGPKVDYRYDYMSDMYRLPNAWG
jgi:hypothetical protein